MIIKRVSYLEWKEFDLTLNKQTTEEFSIRLSERFGDKYMEFDFDKKEEWVEDFAIEGIYKDDVLVGLVEFCDSTLKNGEKSLHISFILIHPSHRRQGYAKQAIQKLIAETPLAYIHAFPSTYHAGKIFQELGFINSELCSYGEEKLLVNPYHGQIKEVV